MRTKPTSSLAELERRNETACRRCARARAAVETARQESEIADAAFYEAFFAQDRAPTERQLAVVNAARRRKEAAFARLKAAMPAWKRAIEEMKKTSDAFVRALTLKGLNG